MLIVCDHYLVLLRVHVEIMGVSTWGAAAYQHVNTSFRTITEVKQH